jgi:ABC-type antimicrobial peptide transport system permease subunit
MTQQHRQPIRENLLLALDTLRTHKFRSLLTLLGVLIGTATVIGVASIFKGLDQQLVDVAEGYGTRSLYIYKFQPGIYFNFTREQRTRKPLTYEEGMAIKERCPSVESVGVEIFVWGPPVTAKHRGQEMVSAELQGNTAQDFHNINAVLQDGRLFTDTDDAHRRDVAVIGSDVVERLFLNEDPIGKEINVDGHTYQVVGTLEKRKGFLGGNENDSVVCIPYFTYRKLYPFAKENFITASVYPGKMNQAIDEVTGLLRRLRNDKPSDPDSFGIATADTFIKEFREIMGTVVLVTMVISSIGLMVGGIGVMNIMLVSVTERTREIGVRKAIGARRSDITWQFLLEAMSLTGAGGVMGILAGYTLSFLIRTLVPALPSTVPLWSAVLGFIVSVSIGLFFGLWPAIKASRLDPIVALRYE